MAGTAFAQEADVEKQARAYYDRGTQAFDEKRYVEALAGTVDAAGKTQEVAAVGQVYRAGNVRVLPAAAWGAEALESL